MKYNLRTVIAIRHAESIRNALKKGGAPLTTEQLKAGAASAPDWLIPLSENGVKQATELSEHLRAKISGLGLNLLDSPGSLTLCTSGFLRCEQTAELATKHISSALHSDRVRDIRLRERDAGYAYDMLQSEYDVQFSYTKQHQELLGDFFYRPPGGESLADVYNRLSLFFHDLALNFPNKRNLIIFSHGGTMRALLS